MVRLTATNAINTVAPAINSAINGEPEVAADGKAGEPVAESGEVQQAKSPNRRRREDYNAYMREYMKKRRGKG